MKAKAIRTVAAVIMGLILMFTAVKMYQREMGLDLKNTTRVEGIVTRAFDTSDTEEADLFDRKRIIAFEITNVPQTLGTSERATDYEKVRATLKPGTPVAIYYRPDQSRLNMNIYQIEKGKDIIMDYKNQEKSSRIVGIMIGLLAVFLLVTGAIMLFSKAKATVQV